MLLLCMCPPPKEGSAGGRRARRRTKSEGGGARKQEWAGAGAERGWQMGRLLEQIEAERMGAVEAEAKQAARRRSASNKVDFVPVFNYFASLK